MKLVLLITDTSIVTALGRKPLTEHSRTSVVEAISTYLALHYVMDIHYAAVKSMCTVEWHIGMTPYEQLPKPVKNFINKLNLTKFSQ